MSSVVDNLSYYQPSDPARETSFSLSLISPAYLKLGTPSNCHSHQAGSDLLFPDELSTVDPSCQMCTPGKSGGSNDSLSSARPSCSFPETSQSVKSSQKAVGFDFKSSGTDLKPSVYSGNHFGVQTKNLGRSVLHNAMGLSQPDLYQLDDEVWTPPVSSSFSNNPVPSQPVEPGCERFDFSSFWEFVNFETFWRSHRSSAPIPHDIVRAYYAQDWDTIRIYNAKLSDDFCAAVKKWDEDCKTTWREYLDDLFFCPGVTEQYYQPFFPSIPRYIPIPAVGEDAEQDADYDELILSPKRIIERLQWKKEEKVSSGKQSTKRCKLSSAGESGGGIDGSTQTQHDLNNNEDDAMIDDALPPTFRYLPFKLNKVVRRKKCATRRKKMLSEFAVFVPSQ